MDIKVKFSLDVKAVTQANAVEAVRSALFDIESHEWEIDRTYPLAVNEVMVILKVPCDSYRTISQRLGEWFAWDLGREAPFPFGSLLYWRTGHKR